MVASVEAKSPAQGEKQVILAKSIAVIALGNENQAQERQQARHRRRHIRQRGGAQHFPNIPLFLRAGNVPAFGQHLNCALACVKLHRQRHQREHSRCCEQADADVHQRLPRENQAENEHRRGERRTDVHRRNDGGAQVQRRIVLHKKL